MVGREREQEKDTLRWQDAWNSLCALLALCHLGRPILAFASHCVCGRPRLLLMDARRMRSLARCSAGPHFWMRAFHSALCLQHRHERVVCESGPAENLLASVPVQPALSRALLYLYIYGCSRSWHRAEVVFVTKDVRWWPKAEPLPSCKKVVLLLVRDVRLSCILLYCSGFLTLLNVFKLQVNPCLPLERCCEEQTGNGFYKKKLN